MENLDKKHVTVIDSICGSGKTRYIFKYIDSHTYKANGQLKKHGRRFFIFVTPYLEEISRLKKENDTFHEPENINDSTTSTKTSELSRLLCSGFCNIAITHTLFLMCIDMITEYVKKSITPYELIIDESPDIYKLYDLKKGDLKNLSKDIDFTEINQQNNHDNIFKNGLGIDEVASCKLKEHSYTILKDGSRYNDIYQACTESNVYIINKSFYISVLPLHKIMVFAEIKFLTYMFEGQFNELYLKAHGFEIDYYHVEKIDNEYELIQGKKAYSGIHLKDKIKLLNPKKSDKSYKFVEPWLNYNDLSSNWHKKRFDKIINKSAKEELTKSIHSVYRSLNATQKNFLWTTYLKRRDLYKELKFNKDICFCSCTARAMNKYAHKRNLAYMINLFPDSNINKFTEKLAHEIPFRRNIFSLSSLIQWVFRSAIRNREPINLYIPSKRMRDLFMEWLNGEFEG